MFGIKTLFALSLSLIGTQSALAFPIVISRDVTLVDPEISTKKAIKEVEQRIKDDAAKGIVHPERASGFRVARTGAPNFKKFQELCKLGIRRMVVMSANGDIETGFANTEWGKKECPGFKVIYNEEQRTGVPLSKTFLKQFDGFIAEAKKDGVGLAFRCNCGCHRTGRLAAYYRMKYLGKPAKESVHDQRKKAGIASLLYRKLVQIQIRALKDYIDDKPCSEAVKKLETADQKYCVQETEEIPLNSVPADDDEAVDTDDDSAGNNHASVNNDSTQKEKPSPASAALRAPTSKAE